MLYGRAEGPQGPRYPEIQNDMPKRDSGHMKEQRERILIATIECIGRMGMQRTSIAEIRRQAELSAGALYVHFRNKEEIIAEALKWGAMTEDMLAGRWSDFKAQIVNFEDQMGFSAQTAAKVRLQLFAECVHPGPSHDALKPMIENSLAIMVRHIQKMVDNGSMRLRMSAAQTALSIGALIEGMVWIALVTDRPLSELGPDLEAGLDCLVMLADDPQ